MRVADRRVAERPVDRQAESAEQVLEGLLVGDQQLLAQLDEVRSADPEEVARGPSAGCRARLERRVVGDRGVAHDAEVVLDPSLGGQAVVVPAHRVEDVLAPHAAVPGDRVGVGVAEHVADVQRARHRRRRRVDREHLVTAGRCGRSGRCPARPTPGSSAPRGRPPRACRGPNDGTVGREGSLAYGGQATGPPATVRSRIARAGAAADADEAGASTTHRTDRTGWHGGDRHRCGRRASAPRSPPASRPRACRWCSPTATPGRWSGLARRCPPGRPARLVVGDVGDAGAPRRAGRRGRGPGRPGAERAERRRVAARGCRGRCRSSSGSCTCAVNYWGVVHGVRAAVPAMMRAGPGPRRRGGVGRRAGRHPGAGPLRLDQARRGRADGVAAPRARPGRARRARLGGVPRQHPHADGGQLAAPRRASTSGTWRARPRRSRQSSAPGSTAATTPSTVADAIVEATRDHRFWILPQPELAWAATDRVRRIAEGEAPVDLLG